MNIQKFWDKQAHNYDYSERQFNPIFKEIINQTKKHLKFTDNALDFGCATGTKTIEIAQYVKHIEGMDFSKKMISVANKKKGESATTNIHFTQGDIFDQQFSNICYDVIITYGVIHLLPNSKEIIRRLHSLLKPSGLLISSTACLQSKMALKNSLEFKAYTFIKKLGIFPLHLNMYKPEDVFDLISQEGFVIIQNDTFFHGITISYIVAKK